MNNFWAGALVGAVVTGVSAALFHKALLSEIEAAEEFNRRLNEELRREAMDRLKER